MGAGLDSPTIKKTGGKSKAKSAAGLRDAAGRARAVMPRLKAAAMEAGTIVGFSALGSVLSGYRAGKMELYSKVPGQLTDYRVLGAIGALVAGLWKPSKASAFLVNAGTGLLTSFVTEKAHGYGAGMVKTPAAVGDKATKAEGVVIGHVDDSGKLSLEQKIARAKRRGHVRHASKLEGKQSQFASSKIEERAAAHHESPEQWARQHPYGRAVRVSDQY